MPSQRSGLTVTALALSWASSVQCLIPASNHRTVEGRQQQQHSTVPRNRWHMPVAQPQTVMDASSSADNGLLETVAQEVG